MSYRGSREDGDVTTYVALLRGINVGGRSKLPMTDLRAELTSAGLGAVRTYIASGNVVLDSDLGPDELVDTVRSLVRQRFELDRPVVVRSADQLARVAERNPFVSRTEDPTKLHVVFTNGLDASPLDGVDPAAFAPEELAVDGDEVYLYLPDGMARSPVAIALERNAPAAVATTRNWRTVLKLVQMCREDR